MQSGTVGGEQKHGSAATREWLAISRGGDGTSATATIWLQLAMMMTMAEAVEGLGEQRVQQTGGSAYSAWDFHQNGCAIFHLVTNVI